MDPVSETSVAISCHRCGYDLRAHPEGAACPECDTLVAESRRVAAVPARPAWRESDPRWRRRVLAGVWLLVLLPLIVVVKDLDLAGRVPVPNAFPMSGVVCTLDDTLLANGVLNEPGLYEVVMFCMGTCLLFAREGGRRRSPLDRTRRWGVLGSYLVLFLSATRLVFYCSLVMVGIGALLQSIPPRYAPGMTGWIVAAGSEALRYAPRPGAGEVITRTAFSAVVVLLACVPLFDALRSCAPKPMARILLAPLLIGALANLATAGEHSLGLRGVRIAELYPRAVYFSPELVLEAIANRRMFATGLPMVWDRLTVFLEGLKWLAVLGIALWLTGAQLAAWAGARRSGDAR